MKSGIIHHLFCRLLVSALFLALSADVCLGERIALITRNNIVPYDLFLQGFQKTAIESGFAHNLLKVFSITSTEEQNQNKLLTDIVEFAPSAIVCIGSGALNISLEHFKSIPCICAMVVTPATLHEIKNTPSACIRMEVRVIDKLKVMQKMLPGVKRIGTVYDPQQCGDQVQELLGAASKLGLHIEAQPVSTTKMAINAIESVMEKSEVFIMFYDKTVLAPQSLKYLYTTAFRQKVPVIGISEKYVRLGALFSLDIDVTDLGRKSWSYVAMCLKNSDTCTGVRYLNAAWRMHINETVARKMSISIPESLREKAAIIE